ncbi:snoRNP complex protein nop56 [Ranunculus cassubicifolius]
MALYILHESASAYSLFQAQGIDEIGQNTEAVKNSVVDLNRFGKVVKLLAFLPYESALDALNQINAVSEGLMTDQLRNFLELNLPTIKEGKKPKYSLGVADPKIGSHIQEVTKIPCQSNEFINELIRGVRQHFERFVKELKTGDLEKAQLGLAHSYSRAKVKFNVNRVDNMVIQAIFLLDTLDKDVNSFSMRVSLMLKLENLYYLELITYILLHSNDMSLHILLEVIAQAKLLRVSLEEPDILEGILKECEAWKLDAQALLGCVKSLFDLSDTDSSVKEGLVDAERISHLLDRSQNATNAGLSLGFDFPEISELQKTSSRLEWCLNAVSFRSKIPLLEILLKKCSITSYEDRIWSLNMMTRFRSGDRIRSLKSWSLDYLGTGFAPISLPESTINVSPHATTLHESQTMANPNVSTASNDHVTEIALRKSTRVSQMPKHLGDYVLEGHHALSTNISHYEPQSYKEAISYPEWQVAMAEELQALEEART